MSNLLVQVHMFRSPGSRGESRNTWEWVEGVAGEPDSVKVPDGVYAFEFEGQPKKIRYYMESVVKYDASLLQADPESWQSYEFLLSSSPTKLLARTSDNHWEAVPPQYVFLGGSLPTAVSVPELHRRRLPL